MKLLQLFQAASADRHPRRAEMQEMERRVLLAAVGIKNAGVDEGSLAAFTVSLDQPVARDVSVRYQTVDWSAAAGKNYRAKQKVVIIPAGQTSATVYIKTLDDGIHAATKRFRVQLSDPDGATLGKSQAVGRIRNTDAAPLVRIVQANPKVARPTTAGGTVTMPVDVRMNGRSELPVTVTLVTQNGTAKAGQDYVRHRRVLTFATGQNGAIQRVNLAVKGAATPQPHEVFAIKLTGEKNARLGRAFAAGTVLGDADLSEGNVVSVDDITVAGGTAATVTLRLNQMPATPVTVNVTTADASATAGSDYTATTGTVTFKPGETEQTIAVPTSAQPSGGTAESFTMLATAGQNVSIGDGQGTVTILPPGSTPPTPAPVPGEITGQGITFSPQSEWAWVGSYHENLKFNYVLQSTRPQPPAGLRMEIFVAPQNADLRTYTPLRSEPVTATWASDGTLRGTIDASGVTLPAGATGLWQIHARLVDAQGLVYGRYGSFLLRA